ncbi:MAG: Arc family DNA-binding protein [Clostridia bacterium]|nr:Arc family DNA-binding protein [Clostridia bacterium]
MNDKKSNGKKQIPLRISDELYTDLERWADDEFRSVNGQIEYLLTQCVKYRKKGAKGLTEEDKKG